MRLFTDASRGDENVGLAYVLELRSGARITGKHHITGEYSSMEAEWYALMEGVHIAIENMTEFDAEISVVVDCQPLVRKIREPNDMYDDTWYEYRKRALDALFEFDEWDLYWRERSSTEQNTTANRLAREALWQAQDDDADGNSTAGVNFE